MHERASTDASTSGMGTTMTVALLENDGTVTIGHVGDSRAYRLRDARLEQLTDDHSLVAELVRRGELSPEEAAVHPQRSVITRALGTDADVDVDAFTVDVADGDVFLLCSDGLSTMVDGEHDRAIMNTHRNDLDAGERADQGGERPRRRRQHHRGPLRGRRGRPVGRRAGPRGRASSSCRPRRRGHAPPGGRGRAAAARRGRHARARRHHGRGRRGLEAAIAAQSTEPPQAGSAGAFWHSP